MSNAVFPTLGGLDIKVKRAPLWSTEVLTSESGKEQRAAWWSTPRFKWSLAFNYLRQGLNGNEAKTLVDFFHQHRGQFESFLFSDPYESAVTAKLFGTGTGAVAAYQLVDGHGYSVIDLNGTPTIFRTDWQGTYQLFSTPRTNKWLQSRSLMTAPNTPTIVTLSPANVAAPDGTYGEVVKITPTTAVNLHYLGQNMVQGAEQRSQVWYVKPDGYNFCYVDVGTNHYVGVNLLTGATFNGVNGTSAVATLLPNGWVKIVATSTTAAGTNTANIHVVAAQGGLSTWAGDGVSGILVWRPMNCLTSELGSDIPTGAAAVTVTDYSINSAGLVTLASTTNPVAAQSLGTASGSTATFAVVTPNGSTPTVLAVCRTDWQGRQRMYPTARTNRQLYSDGPTLTGGWSTSDFLGTGTQCTVTPNYAAAPDGSMTASRLQASQGAGSSSGDYSFVSGTVYSVGAGQSVDGSCWVKSNTGASQQAYLAIAGGGPKLITVTTEWTRVDTYFSNSIAWSARLNLGLRGTYTPANSNLDILVAKCQLEDGTSATGFIHTTTATVTVTDRSQSGSNVVFASNPLAGALIEADYSYVGGLGVGNTLTWTGSYYRRVRFDMDELDLERIFGGTASGGGQTWEGKTVKLISVK